MQFSYMKHPWEIYNRRQLHENARHSNAQYLFFRVLKDFLSAFQQALKYVDTSKKAPLKWCVYPDNIFRNHGVYQICSFWCNTKFFKNATFDKHKTVLQTKIYSITSSKNSFEKRNRILFTEAPNTFRMPTSFIFCSAIKEARPYRPRQLRKIANAANIL